MLKRKAMEQLEFWKSNKTRQALLVTGVRQAGKTFLIREFAKKHYKHFIEVNLLEDEDTKRAFEQAKSSDDYLLALSLIDGANLVKHETVIFIDEVQESKEVVTAIKFLVEKGDYDYILSGSLLGIELNDIRSFPVGYLHIVEMFPLDFEEYCWARGVGSAVWEVVFDCFIKRQAVPEFVHERLIRLYHEYLVVGGMPDPVQAFTENKDMQAIRSLQDDIVSLYKKDVTQYNRKRARIIKRIYDLIPNELNKQNKRFTIKTIDGNPRLSRYEDDFLWLVDASVAIAVYCVSEPRHPLLLSSGSTLFKLFLSDVGLLASLCGMDATRETLLGSKGANFGSFFENAVAQELKAHGFSLYYFKNDKMGELDFVIETKQGQVIPIEVKSGKHYKRHSSLTNVLKSQNYGIEHAYVFCESNLKSEPQITYCPIYMVSCL